MFAWFYRRQPLKRIAVISKTFFSGGFAPWCNLITVVLKSRKKDLLLCIPCELCLHSLDSIIFNAYVYKYVSILWIMVISSHYSTPFLKNLSYIHESGECRLQFIECRSGYYGANCKHKCSGNCRNQKKCDRKTGECHDGCLPGWRHTTCDESKTRS